MGIRITEKLVEAAQKYHHFTTKHGELQTADSSMAEQGLEADTVLKRTIVIGIARDLIDNACHLLVAKGTLSDLDFLLDRFIAEVTNETTAHPTKVNESLYEHITRTMEANQGFNGMDVRFQNGMRMPQ